LIAVGLFVSGKLEKVEWIFVKLEGFIVQIVDQRREVIALGASW